MIVFSSLGITLENAVTDSLTDPVELEIDSDLNNRIMLLANSRQRTALSLIHDAIRQYVEREEESESLRQDCINAWTDYQSTGLHVTEEEADQWLAKLEAGEDAEPPECHV